MDQVRLGLLGLGSWPREAYLPVLKELASARVTAVACARSEAEGRTVSVDRSCLPLLHG